LFGTLEEAVFESPAARGPANKSDSGFSLETQLVRLVARGSSE